MSGVGFLFSKRAKDTLLGYNPVNSRIILARFYGAPLNISVIQVYVPTPDSTEEDIKAFYGQLEHIIEELRKKYMKIVMGDWNAKVGTYNVGLEQVMGRYGYGERNDRGERLLEFVYKNDLLITSTRFQQMDSRKWTWMAPDGKHTNMIDLLLVDKRWNTAVRVCRTFQGADNSSDHSLVMCKLKLRLTMTRRQQRRESRKNVDALGNTMVPGAFKEKVEQGLIDLTSQPMERNDRVRRLNEAIQQAVREILPTVCKPKKPWITEHNLKLAKKKREMKQRRQESEEIEKEC
jgi:exonuclease III